MELIGLGLAKLEVGFEVQKFVLDLIVVQFRVVLMFLGLKVYRAVEDRSFHAFLLKAKGKVLLVLSGRELEELDVEKLLILGML